MILASSLAALALALASPPEADANASRAKSLYGEGRYEEAAALFDRLWEEEGASKYLYNAAAAHEAAGRDVAALVAYLHYLHLDEVDPEEWREVKDRVGQLRARLVPVSVILTPGALRGMATLVARRSDDGATVRVDLEWLDASSGAEGTLHLTPGLWIVRVELRPPADGHYEPGRESPVYVPLPGEEAAGAAARLTATPVESALTLRLGPPEALRRGVEIRLYDQLGVESTVEIRTREAEVRIPLRSGPWRYFLRGRGRQEVSGEVEVTRGGGDVVERVLEGGGAGIAAGGQSGHLVDRRRRLVLGAGLGVASVALMAAGGAITAVSKQRYDDGITRWNGIEGGGLTSSAVRSTDLLVAGGGSIGAGIGSALGAVTMAAGVRRPVLISEFCVGGASVIAGSIVLGYSYRQADRAEWVQGTNEAAGPRAPLEEQRPGAFGGSVAVGVGIGLIAGALLGSLAPKMFPERVGVRTHPVMGATVLGGAVAWNF